MKLLPVKGVRSKVEVRCLQCHGESFAIGRKTRWFDKNDLILSPTISLLIKKCEFRQNDIIFNSQGTQIRCVPLFDRTVTCIGAVR